MKNARSTRRLQLIGGLLQVGAVHCPCCEVRMYMEGAERLKAFNQATAKAENGWTPTKETRNARTATVDHIVPSSAGGTNRIENLLIMCRSCNSEKDALSMVEWVELRRNSGRSFAKVTEGYLLALHVRSMRARGQEP